MQSVQQGLFFAFLKICRDFFGAADRLDLEFLIAVFIWIRWTYPRTQIYKLLNLSWKVLIPFSLAILLLSAVFIKIEGFLI